MEISRINAVNTVRNNNQKNNVSFGHVIPVSVKLDGKMLEQSIENKELFKSFVYRFITMLNKGKGEYANIANKFRKVDSDFDGKLASIRGAKNSLWARRRFLISGADKDALAIDGRNIGWKPGDTSRAIYQQNEFDLRKDDKKLIKGVSNFTIDVKSRIVNHKNGTQSTAYDILGGHFMIKKGDYERITGIKLPPKAQPKAATKATQQATKQKAQGEFDFASQVENAQRAKEASAARERARWDH